MSNFTSESPVNFAKFNVWNYCNKNKKDEKILLCLMRIAVWLALFSHSSSGQTLKFYSISQRVLSDFLLERRLWWIIRIIHYRKCCPGWEISPRKKQYIKANELKFQWKPMQYKMHLFEKLFSFEVFSSLQCQQ